MVAKTEVAQAKEDGKDKIEQVKADAEAAAKTERVEPELTAPGEAAPAGKTVKVKATGPFLVLDPYTGDYVGEAGGEMRETQFVIEKIAEGKLEEA